MDFLVGYATQSPIDSNAFEGYGESWRAFAAIESDTGLYGKVGYEDGRFRLFGQPFFGVNAATAGVGYRMDISESFSVHLEGGWWAPVDKRLVPAIRDEIAFTYLTSRHTAGGTKPIPLPSVSLADGTSDYAPCNDWGGEWFPNECYDSEARLEGNPYVEIGATPSLYKGLEASVGYRYIRPSSYISIYHPETRESGGGYWEESGFLSGDTVNFAVQWRF
jgi:hypothetical protein